MISHSIKRLKDLVLFVSMPGVRTYLLRARSVGLETLLDYQRLAMLVVAVLRTADLEGDIIEFGTFRGGSAGLILQTIGEGKILHVCDSFDGMPDVSAADNYHRKGDFHNTESERVRSGLAELADNFAMHIGFFSNTIPEMETNKSLKFCFAHIDADLYESIHEALAFCYPRMSTGGIMIFDDYGAPTCEGAKKAVDEFFANKVETVVPLSMPAHGCVVGGGNAYDVLSKECGFPLSVRFIASKVFQR